MKNGKFVHFTRFYTFFASFAIIPGLNFKSSQHIFPLLALKKLSTCAKYPI
jgi:hypothetical protein